MSRPKVFSLLIVGELFLLTTFAYGQYVGTLQKWPSSSWLKAENGLVINWHRQLASDAASSTIHIYDTSGYPLLDFDILKLVPDATGVAIYDVSARRDQLVAVAAIYVKGPNETPAGTLLIFNFKGILQSAVALNIQREIMLLELDDSLNIWTLLFDSGGLDPSNTSFVAEYSKSGSFVREVIARNTIPVHAEQILQNPQAGAAATGFDSTTHTFWFWLPVSTDLVAIRTTDGSVVSHLKTGLPRIKDHLVWPLQMGRDSSGSVVATFGIRPVLPNAQSELAYYAWSPESSAWSRFDPGYCKGSFLVGVQQNIQVYFLADSSKSLCTYTRP